MLGSVLLLVVVCRSECALLHDTSTLELVQVIGAYNKVKRWSPRSEVGDDLLDDTIFNVLGGENVSKQMFNDIIIRAENLESHIDSEKEIPMRITASAAYYSALRTFIKNAPGMQRGTCGTWIEPKHLIAGQSDLFNYVMDASNQDKPVAKLIEKYVKGFKTKRELRHKLRKIGEEIRVEFALNEVHEVREEYLKLKWFDNPAEECESEKPDLKALVALQIELIDNTSHNDECHPTTLNTMESFKSALISIGEALSDYELLNALFTKAEIQRITEQYGSLKKVSKNALGILSLAAVRDIITEEMGVKECNLTNYWSDAVPACSCRLQYRVSRFQNSLQRIRKIIPPQLSQCNASWNDFRLDTRDTGLLVYFKQNKEYLMNEVNQIQGIDAIFEIFSGKTEFYYRKPYTGIPYADVPVKHGLWWLATFFFRYETCQQFISVQKLGHLLEMYSSIYYWMDFIVLDRCGLLPTITVDDSVIMANERNSMILYDMYRTFYYEDLVITLELADPSTVTENGYELVLWILFQSLTNTQLSLDPKDHEQALKTFLEFSVQGIQNENLEGDMIVKQLHLFNTCASCDVLSNIKATIDIIYIKLMNYDDGRLLPFSFEKEVYVKARSDVTERDRSVLSNCLDSVEEQFELYKESSRAVFTSNLMNDPAALNTYMSFVGFEGISWTPQKVLQAVNQVTDSSQFSNSVTMRLYKSGKCFQLTEEDLNMPIAYRNLKVIKIYLYFSCQPSHQYFIITHYCFQLFSETEQLSLLER